MEIFINENIKNSIDLPHELFRHSSQWQDPSMTFQYFCKKLFIKITICNLDVAYLNILSNVIDLTALSDVLNQDGVRSVRCG